ncbi:MAG: hypothetical protein ABIR19_11360 [Ginsengibacter sp.]
MNTENESLQELRHIKQMMERSTRFSSLSGFSGIAAGICALGGIWLVVKKINLWREINLEHLDAPKDNLATDLLLIAISTFVAAAIFSFLFVYLRCKKLNIPLMGMSARRVVINMAIPLLAGSLFILRLATTGNYLMIPPACLIFYGLALVNASKYTLEEIRYLGLLEIIIGVINLWLLGHGLTFWAVGFGLLHILYGIIIWWKYEKNGIQKAGTITND